MKIGIYNLHMHARGGGEKKTLVLADHLSRAHDVWLFVNESEVDSWESYFGVDLSKVRIVVLSNHVGPQVNGRSSRRNQRREVRSRLFGHFRQIKSVGLDLFINNSFCSNLPSPAPRGIYMCMFPYCHPLSPRTGLRRVYRLFFDQVEQRVLGCRVSDFVNSYSAVTAVSEFTASWVDKMWQRRAEVLFSVCENMGPPAPKDKIVLNVGRFVARGGRLFKRQDILLEAFREMTHLRDQDWQLHFAGSVAPDRESHAIVADLTKAAGGMPVHFHFDTDFETLRDLYRRASIYWHATGYGVLADEDPSAQEHFGNTTIEAMSAGAVPIVINSGGQCEIVDHGRDGFLWNDLTQLSQYTTRLAAEPELMMRMSEAALSSSSRFSRSAFLQGVDGVIARVSEQTWLQASPVGHNISREAVAAETHK
jgi:glycosyltransferase involved in cell wall biosynthesis